MKINFNINYLYSKLAVDTLIKLGVKYVCISPGSRNTPLTLAFANAKKINKYLILDERSSAFFALGIAKATNIPVAIVTTSGTAVAELYPAIIEAFNSRTPLIILTADRPVKLYGTGANQTINQINIFSNHIRFFADIDVEKCTFGKLTSLMKKLNEAFFISAQMNKGPVHLNFHFSKPLEPFSFNCSIKDNLIETIQNKNFTTSLPKIKNKTKDIFQIINSSEKVLFYSGGGNFNKEFLKGLLKLSTLLNIPILVDALSPLKTRTNKNLILNAPSFLGADKALELMSFDLIIQFGAPPTTQRVLNYFENSKARKIAVNYFGDLQDPSRTTEIILQKEPGSFLKDLLNNINLLKKKNKSFLNKIRRVEVFTENFKLQFLSTQSFLFEGKIIFELLNIIPNNSLLFISNSMPIRDLDYFAPQTNKNLKIFYNRGASGIDGIISTALGISITSRNMFLLTGDLAFLHDLNAFQTAAKYNLNLLIIVINNNGGGIFRLLPISKEKNYFNDYFILPHNINIKKIANAFNTKFKKVRTKKEFVSSIMEFMKLKGIRIIEINTNSRNSTQIRKAYWKHLENELEDKLQNN